MVPISFQDRTNKVVINQTAGYLLLRISCKLTGSVDAKSMSVPVK